jgi:hypothetical protein
MHPSRLGKIAIASSNRIGNHLDLLPQLWPLSSPDRSAWRGASTGNERWTGVAALTFSAIEDHVFLLLVSHLAALLPPLRFTRLKHVNSGELRSYELRKLDGHHCNHVDLRLPLMDSFTLLLKSDIVCRWRRSAEVLLWLATNSHPSQLATAITLYSDLEQIF